MNTGSHGHPDDRSDNGTGHLTDNLCPAASDGYYLRTGSCGLRSWHGRNEETLLPSFLFGLKISLRHAMLVQDLF
jgi:hypothetical protein